MAFEKNPDEIGQLWAKQGGKGPYMTGEVLGQKVVCFPVKSDNPKAPAWRVLKSRPIEERDTQPKGRDIGGGFTADTEDPLF